MAASEPMYASLMSAGGELLAAGNGDAGAALAKFDAAVALRPETDALQWQRGLALFYCGRYADGSEQFRRNMASNGSDVEEVVWRIACDARRHGLPAARARAMACGHDDRAGMPAVLELWLETGTAGIAAVALAATDATTSAYSNFYIGFFLDVIGQQSAAMPYLKAAAMAPSADYMGRLFVMHHRRATTEQQVQSPVSRFGSGAYAFSGVVVGGWQLSAGHHDDWDELEALEAMESHRRRGMDTIDMGDIYTGVEELVGQHIARHAMAGGATSAIKIHTKLVPDLDRLGQVDQAYCEGVLTRSKNRLRLVRPLDLVQFHWWDWDAGDHVAAYRALCSLRPGLVANVGVTNYDAAHLAELLAQQLPVASNQIQYSLLDGRAEAQMVPLCLRHNVRLLCYGVLAGGFLTDRWLGQPEPSMDGLPNRSLVKYKLIIDEFGGWELFQQLLTLCRGVADGYLGAGVSDVAIAYILGQDVVGGVILGASNSSHLASSLRASRLPLSGADIRQIRGFLEGHRKGPNGAFYALERQRDGEHGKIMRYTLNRLWTTTHFEEVTQRAASLLASARCGGGDDAAARKQTAAEIGQFLAATSTAHYAGAIKASQTQQLKQLVASLGQ